MKMDIPFQPGDEVYIVHCSRITKVRVHRVETSTEVVKSHATPAGEVTTKMKIFFRYEGRDAPPDGKCSFFSRDLKEVFKYPDELVTHLVNNIWDYEKEDQYW